MAAAPLNEEELRELCVDLAAALISLSESDCSPIEWPMPDEIVEKLHEREALAATMRTLPESERERLRGVYEEEYKKVDLDVPSIELPAETVLHREEMIDELTERMRVAGLRDGELHRLVGEHIDLPYGL